MKKAILALLVFVAAGTALGDLSKYKDWAKSPEAYFLTAPEREEWAKLTSDEDAEKFIQLYWAKRGGDAFKKEVMRRIDAADQQFKMRRYERGALSTRGRLIVVLGPPDKQMRERAEETAQNTRGSGASAADITTGAGATMFLTWIYEQNHFPADWGVPEVRAKILVDQVRGSDELQLGSPVEKAIAKVAEKTIINPSGKPAAPVPAAAAAAAAAPPAPVGRPAVPAAAVAPPPAPVAASVPAAVRSILEAAAKENKPALGAFWGGSFRTQAGDAFYAFELVLPAEKAGAGLKFGGIVTTDAGEEKASFWEDALPTESKTGGATAKVFAHSVSLAPGSYRGSFGLFPADGKAALVSAVPNFKLEPKSDDFEVSPLILTNLLTPLGRRAQPAEPFIFGRPEKPIQIVPKADRLYTSQDSLWYFFTVRNPGKPAEAAAASAPAPASTPAPAGKAPAAPGAPAPEAARPRVMTTISVLRNGKNAFQPSTAPADLEPLGEGIYGEGKEIPLEKFESGYYTFILNVRDLNAPRDSAASKGSERRADFVVLKADGSMPDKPAPAPAAKPPAKKG